MLFSKTIATAAGILALSLWAVAAEAQNLDVDFADEGGDGEAAWCGSSTVAGLDPSGDGFLAVRSGPGSQYRKLAELRNGAVVGTCARRAPWVAVIHGPDNRKGWVHGGWLRDLAG